MKLNKTLMIAALLASSLVAMDMAVRAQDATNSPAVSIMRPPHQDRLKAGFDRIAKQLALTAEQKNKVEPIFDEMHQKMVDLRKDSTLDQTDHHAKVKEIINAVNSQLKEVLTAEQFAKWQKMSTPHHSASAGGNPSAQQ